jgi:magnesium-transporting ATPase (P-type)
MATGDNILTGIAVGKECGLIDADNEVFVGDLKKEKAGNEKIVWKNIN